MVKNGDLLFEQIPMVEIDCMKLVQTRAILNYIARKCKLYGKDEKDQVWIDMYVDGTSDLMTLILSYFFMSEADQKKQRQLMRDRALKRYFPVYEKALENHKFLVGEQLSLADVHLLEAILSMEEFHPDILQDFPNLQAFKTRTSEIPTIKKFLEPGSKRKPIADEVYITCVKEVLF
ncbi:glutathione S-transferase 3-like isoform X2 [Hyperolius riggenbachi]